MQRPRAFSLPAAVVLALAASAPVIAATPDGQAGEWHRNNYNAGEEQLFCREAAASWTCTYVIPDGTGRFSGTDVTDSWMCPEWFSGTICENVTAVYHGRFLFVPAGGATSAPVVVSQDYVITEVEGRSVLQLYWVDRFVCPWYRTFEEALENDFNCVFAPS